MRARAAVRPWNRGEALLAGFLVLLVAVLTLYPLAMLIYGSFQSGSPGAADSHFTLSHLVRVYGDPDFYRAWGTTLLVSLGATLVALAVGLPSAWLVARTDLPYRSLAELLIVLPVFVSPFIGAVAWTGLGAPRVGLLNRLLAALGIGWQIDIYSPVGIMGVLGIYLAPYVYLFTRGPMGALDASLEEASRLSGHGALATLRRITLPLVLPSILASTLLVLVLAMENFGVPAVLAMPARIRMVSTEIFVRYAYPPVDNGYATAVALSLVVLTLLLLWVQRRILQRRTHSTIGGRGYIIRPVPLGRWRPVAALVFLAFFSLTTLLPFAVLILASFQAYWTQEFTAFTLDNYRAIYTRTLFTRSVTNSLVLSVGGAALATVLSALLAYMIQRTRAPGRHALEQLATLPLGVPGMVLGIGLLWAWIWVPLPIYGTLWILVIALTTRFLPFGVGNIGAALGSVNPELEAAARVFGAGRWRTALTVVLPLVRGSLISAWVIYFIDFLKELNASVLLYSFNSVVLPVLIFDRYTEGKYPEVAALAVGMCVLIALVLLVCPRLFKVQVAPRV